ncbi:hypothetical protein [Sorangium sp. So ce1153]|uniref:hypothetical protein n=1 Tax=Sorangium sp. So ce1153 TaxID=3133333 RepID=UPI003F619FA2
MRCRSLARRAAWNAARRRAQALHANRRHVDLVGPMLARFGCRPFRSKDAADLAALHGLSLHGLRQWLWELAEEDGTLLRHLPGWYAFDVPAPVPNPVRNPSPPLLLDVDAAVPHLDADPSAEAAPIGAGTGRALDILPEGREAPSQRGRGAVGAAEGGDIKRGRPKRPWAGCSGDLVDRLLPVFRDHRERATAMRSLVDELDLDAELGAELGANAVAVSVPLVLYRVSVTQPEHRRAAYDADARAFADRMMAEGSAGVLLAKDVREPARLPRWFPQSVREVLRVATGGAPHGYGWVLREAGAEEAISSAWIQTAHAHSGCQKVTHVTGWKAFAKSGDPGAREGKRGTFRENLARVVDYAFKPWPAEYGERDLARDVVASGVFAPVWAEVLRAGRAPPRPPPPLLAVGAFHP